MDIDVFAHLGQAETYQLKSIEVLETILTNENRYLLMYLKKDGIALTEVKSKETARYINEGREFIMVDGWMFPSACFTPA